MLQALAAGIATTRENQRRDRQGGGSSIVRSALLDLPDVMFYRIYSEIPQLVAPHTAVCKQFRDQLIKAAHAHLVVRSCPTLRKQVTSMRRFRGRITVSLHDPDSKSKLAFPFVDVMCGGTLAEVGNALPIGWKNLTALNFSATRLPHECLERLGNALQACNAIQQLDFTGNQIGPSGVRSLLPALLHLPQLRRLDLGGNDLKMPGLAALSEQMQPTRLASLEYLDLSDNKLGSQGVRQLGAAYTRAAVHPILLKHLDLSKNGIDGAAVEQLAAGLELCTSLTSLDLSVNKEFGAPGVRHLAPILKNNTLITCINLNQAGLYPEGLAALSGTLDSCLHLKEMKLYDNNMGDKGAAHLTSIFER